MVCPELTAIQVPTDDRVGRIEGQRGRYSSLDRGRQHSSFRSIAAERPTLALKEQITNAAGCWKA